MRKTHLLSSWLVAATFLLIIACAVGKQQYDTGIELYADHRYTEAIAYIEQAIEREPTNNAYKKKLSDIKDDLISRFVSEGLDTLSSNTPLTVADITSANSSLSKAQDIDRDNTQVKGLADAIRSEEESFLSGIRDLYLQSQKHRQKEEWLEAYFQLQQIQSRYPNYEDTSQMVSDVISKGHQDFHTRATSLVEEEDFEDAMQYLRKALSLKGDHQPSLDLLSLAQERNNADFFIAKAEELASVGDWKAATHNYTRALDYRPDDQELMDLISQMQGSALDSTITEAQEQLDSGWLLKAIRNYEKATQYTTHPGDHRLDSLRGNLIVKTNAIAEHFQAERSFGAAWFWYEQIGRIEPDYPNLFFLSQKMEDGIKERVKKSIAVFPFDSPSNSSDAGLIVANNLITFLFKSASGDIKILERENLTSILEEMKLGQVGIVAQESAKEMGQMYGIDVAIMGSVLIYNVDSISSKGQKTVKQTVGTTIEDNIDYLNWKARNPDPNKSEIANAPPAKIKVSKEINVDYEVSFHKKIGFIQIAFRIVDVATGENIQVETIEKKFTVEDESSSGIPDAGIKFDPLDIPSDTEIIQKITIEVVSELGREALKPLQNLERGYYEDGEKLLRRRSNLEATESFVNAIFDEKLKMIQGSPLTIRAEKYIEDIFRDHNTNSGN